MKDLKKLTMECRSELESIGIKCGTVRNITVNTRAKKRWGCCTTVSKGVFDISISEKLLQDDVDDKAAKDTIIHELLHTVKGCKGHKGKWVMLAKTVNERLGYDIKRTTSGKEKGIEEEAPPMKIKYILICENCGAEIRRQKASSVVMHPERYRCAKCRGRLKRKF